MLAGFVGMMALDVLRDVALDGNETRRRDGIASANAARQ